MQIVGRRLNGNVPHVHGQFGQAILNVGPISVPTEKRLHGKTVPEVMHAGPSPLFIPDGGSIEKSTDRAPKSGVTVRMKITALVVAQKRRTWVFHEALSPLPQIDV
jgi:hypothetical protein